MKKILFFCAVIASLCYAQQYEYMLGLRNGKYGSAGLTVDQKWGAFFENSIFVEYLEFQYARLAVFYKFQILNSLSGEYILYSGIRYNRDFFDVGGYFNMLWKPFPRRFRLSLSLQPYYDSDLKHEFGYCFESQIMPFSEVGFFAGVKNQAEYRNPELRLFGGIVFDTPHIVLKPEISIPIDQGLSSARVSVSFNYHNAIWD